MDEAHNVEDVCRSSATLEVSVKELSMAVFALDRMCAVDATSTFSLARCTRTRGAADNVPSVRAGVPCWCVQT